MTFADFIAGRVHDLEAELRAARKEAEKQRRLAELWRQRALAKPRVPVSRGVTILRGPRRHGHEEAAA